MTTKYTNENLATTVRLHQTTIELETEHGLLLSALPSQSLLHNQR